MVAIVGPSGSGKTTLLHVLGSLDQPDTGKVWIDGVDTTACSDSELAALRATRIGFVFLLDGRMVADTTGGLQ